MKFNILLIILVTGILSVSSSKSNEDSDETVVGFVGGLSTPNNQVADFYNADRIRYSIDDIDKFGKFVLQGIDMGYHLGVRLRFPLDDRANFIAGMTFNRFPESMTDVVDPATGQVLTTLQVTSNIVPLSAGINYFIIDSFIGIYAMGELSYNYMFYTVDIPQDEFSLPISKTSTHNRLGYGFGAGIDLDLGLTKLNLEGKYNLTNIIGKEDGESNKEYFSLSLGFYF